MRTTSAARTARTARSAARPRLRARFRDLLAKQMRLWNGVLDDLEPWRQEGPLRWHGDRLEGALLTEANRQPTR